MTTLLGIRANGSDEGIVLAADTKIDYTTRVRSQTKIWKGEQYALAVAGNIDKYVESFWDYLSGKYNFEKFFTYVSGGMKGKTVKDALYALGQPPQDVRERVQALLGGRVKPRSPIEEMIIRYQKNEETPKTEVDKFILALFQKTNEAPTPIETAVSLEYFMEVDILNRSYIRRNEENGRDEKIIQEDNDNTSEFLLASCRNGLGLYHVDAYGTVREPTEDDVEYLSLGTGAAYVKEFIDDEEFYDDPYVMKKVGGKVKLNDLSVRTACIIATAALKKAISRDRNSASPIELVAIRTGRSIVSHIELVQGNLERAEEASYDQVFEREGAAAHTEEKAGKE